MRCHIKEGALEAKRYSAAYTRQLNACWLDFPRKVSRDTCYALGAKEEGDRSALCDQNQGRPDGPPIHTGVIDEPVWVEARQGSPCKYAMRDTHLTAYLEF